MRNLAIYKKVARIVEYRPMDIRSRSLRFDKITDYVQLLKFKYLEENYPVLNELGLKQSGLGRQTPKPTRQLTSHTDQCMRCKP